MEGEQQVQGREKGMRVQERGRPGQVPRPENGTAKEKTRVQCPGGWGRPMRWYDWGSLRQEPDHQG